MATAFSEDIDQSNWRISFLIFLIFVAFFSVAFRFIPLPSRETVDDSLEDIMFELITISEEAEEEPEETIEEAIEELVEPADVEVQQENIDELLSAFAELTPAATPDDVSLTNSGSVQSVILENELNPQLDFDAGILDGFSNQNTLDLDTDISSRSGSSSAWTLKPGLSADAGASTEQRGFAVRNQASGPTGDDLAVRQQQEPTELFDLFKEERGTGDMSLDEIRKENAVIAWFKANASPLDSGIRALFEQTDSDLTAKVLANISGQGYPVQLMYSASSRNLRIAFSEDTNIFYFIDPKLQDQANYYEEGVVVHDDQIRIVIVETEEFSVSSPQAVRVYSSFLQWWLDQIREYDQS
ncbi:MAG: hypothetical protein OXF06_12830 [Bacteroidetes bacterium]|nr:hypothetical protein [Bacteroidota bacterium]